METINEPAELSCSLEGTNLTDCGLMDGTITVTGMGGTGTYTYSLNQGIPQTSNFFDRLDAGYYEVMIFDANGCSSMCNISLSSPNSPSCSIINTTDVTCFNGNNGTVQILGQGGSGNLEYSIDGGATYQGSGIFENLEADDYVVIVRNVGNLLCMSNCFFTIYEPLRLECEATSDPTLCNGDE